MISELFHGNHANPVMKKPYRRNVRVPPVAHYENFPVASFLCPHHLRAAITAIYHFARTADDLADEGQMDSTVRMINLRTYRHDLSATIEGHPCSGRWHPVFGPLYQAIITHHLPPKPFFDLLDAFEQDVSFTHAERHYDTDAELMDYCQRSANPIGRLLLHLYGIEDETSLAQSDQICTALQLINFWQDVSVDRARGRYYISTDAMTRYQVADADFLPDSTSQNATELIAAYASSARVTMLKGAQLALRIPGRAGWELRLVVQGGLRILDKIEAQGFTTWHLRPKLTLLDVPIMLWRALWMDVPGCDEDVT